MVSPSGALLALATATLALPPVWAIRDSFEADASLEVWGDAKHEEFGGRWEGGASRSVKLCTKEEWEKYHEVLSKHFKFMDKSKKEFQRTSAAAVELNANPHKYEIPEGFCAVWSTRTRAWMVMWRDDREEAAMEAKARADEEVAKLKLREAEQLKQAEPKKDKFGPNDEGKLVKVVTEFRGLKVGDEGVLQKVVPSAGPGRTPFQATILFNSAQELRVFSPELKNLEIVKATTQPDEAEESDSSDLDRQARVWKSRGTAKRCSGTSHNCRRRAN
jgi:hypothetical protein